MNICTEKTRTQKLTSFREKSTKTKANKWYSMGQKRTKVQDLSEKGSSFIQKLKEKVFFISIFLHKITMKIVFFYIYLNINETNL